MKILLVGSGGREHAMAESLAGGGETSLSAFMGRRNPGIARLATGIRIGKETEVGKIRDFAVEEGVDCAVIGPEAPLEAGVVDRLEEAGIPCAGPTRAAARLETDKAFCRDMMAAHGIDGCPRYRVFHDPAEASAFIESYEGDLVVKPIGLTGGKGVRVMGEHVDRPGAVAYARSLGGHVVLEERLVGEEFTLQAFVDGSHLVPAPLVQDHKRAFEGDTGPNTGGMGSYSLPDHRLPFVSEADYRRALGIMEEAVRALAREGFPYRGILYGQFMNTRDGPRVVEFNARFGDPEAMNVLPIMTAGLGEVVCRIIDGTLSASKVGFRPVATVCKYVVPEGYPEAPRSAEPIAVGDAGRARLYYANVEETNGSLATLTSRTLAFVGIAGTLEEAERAAEAAASSVKGRVYHRRDIGTRELLARRSAHMEALR
ncbi:MAG: phosphoribosylamine--glycine ligase [Methanomicrobiales archaeon]|nr:phosphoribosylamine--glycine ligase [Methanomicrobiales archaeon]MDD1670026.1 phosphoribosylamine--glycine ligase [Methanomicrobiales archaeon]